MIQTILLMMIPGLCNLALGQDTVLNTIQKGRLDSVNSAILKQKRMIQVFLPASYKPGSTDKYDVLYVLDGGNWNTGLVSRIQRFVQDQGFMPSTIIVSVMGIDRNVELTPSHLDSWKGSGGAKDFLEFITTELIPHINKNYPSNGDNTLWGHSLSGMFVIYAMLNKPMEFKSYIAVDPSCWWDNCLVPKMAAHQLPGLHDIDATLYIGGRDSGGLRNMKIDTMVTVLKNSAPAGLHWKLTSYPGESHSSVRLKTTYDALMYTYEGFTSGIEVYPNGGIVARHQPFIVWCFDDTTRLHYTLDGSIPTLSSPKGRREVTIDSGVSVTYKHFGNRSRYDKFVTRNYIQGAILKPITLPKNVKPGGFWYTYYESAGTNPPDLKLSKPLKTGIMDKDFNPDSLHRKGKYAFVMDGFMEAKDDGYYMLFMAAGKGAKLYLGNQLLMDWDENFKGDNYSFNVPLAKGFYPIHIEYFDQKEQFRFMLQYLTPTTMASGDATPIPFDLQYGKR